MLDNKAHIVFVAEYPDVKTIKEGMAQRIVAMDKQFEQDNRLYLQVSHRFFVKRQSKDLPNGCVQYRCNLFVDFFFIVNLFLKSKLIFYHSIQNVLPVLPALFAVPRGKKMVLDLHGVVPEEHVLAGQPRKARFYSMAEQYIFKRLSLTISVTDAMKAHFRRKYPESKTEMLTYPILPSNITNSDFSPMEEDTADVINVVYSGNVQVWQNIEMMVDVISKNLSPRIKYYILTGDPDTMNGILKNKGLAGKDGIQVNSVQPDELKKYYAIAHYGFILRDDIVVNSVACPTKLIEYMHYGMIPIVKCQKIGDFAALGYDYIDVKDFNFQTIQKRKSDKNHLIISKMKKDSESIDLRSMLLTQLK
jgi:hypothetical protein